MTPDKLITNYHVCYYYSTIGFIFRAEPKNAGKCNCTIPLYYCLEKKIVVNCFNFFRYN